MNVILQVQGFSDNISGYTGRTTFLLAYAVRYGVFTARMLAIGAMVVLMS